MKFLINVFFKNRELNGFTCVTIMLYRHNVHLHTLEPRISAEDVPPPRFSNIPSAPSSYLSSQHSMKGSPEFPVFPTIDSTNDRVGFL